jgi:hypothetical protein
MLLCYSTLKFFWFDLLQNGRGINGRYTDHEHYYFENVFYINYTDRRQHRFSCIYIVCVLLGRNGASNDFSGTFVC